MSVKFYHNIPLVYVTKNDILNVIFSESQKNRKCCDNIIKKKTKKKYEQWCACKDQPKTSEYVKNSGTKNRRTESTGVGDRKR